MSATFNQLNSIASELSRNSGTVFGAIVDANGKELTGYESFGFVDTTELTASADTIEAKNSAEGPNVTVGSATINTTINLSMAIKDLNPANIAKLFFGDKTDVAAEETVTETKKAYLGMQIDLDGILPEDTTNLVVEQSGGTATSYTEGTDYVVERTGGITILESGSIVDEEEIDITYDTVATTKIEGFTKSDLYMKLIVRGLNNATSKYFKTVMHLVQLSPTEGFSFIDPENYTVANISGTLIASKEVTGSGLSKLISHTVEQESA